MSSIPLLSPIVLIYFCYCVCSTASGALVGCVNRGLRYNTLYQINYCSFTWIWLIYFPVRCVKARIFIIAGSFYYILSIVCILVPKEVASIFKVFSILFFPFSLIPNFCDSSFVVYNLFYACLFNFAHLLKSR